MTTGGFRTLRASLRSGAWLTRERIRLIAFGVLAASLFAIVFMLATAKGLNDFQGRPLGTDFSSFYAAGTLARHGDPAAPYDPALQHAQEKAIFGDATPFYSWLYPPLFLPVAASLASLPYPLALLCWLGVTLALYLLAMRTIVVATSSSGRQGEQDDTASAWWVLLALAYPAVFVNFGHGQNGFLSAALLGGVLATLDRRPLLSGFLIGLLAYKPQLGMLFPLVLAASGRWRAFGAAAVTVVLLGLATFAIFGAEVWRAFFASTHFTRVILLENGDVGWEKIESVFSWVRMWGGPVPLAYAIQAGISLSVAAALVWLWRSDAAFALKAAALCLSIALVSPFSLDYDMMVLAPALAFLALHGLAHGFAPYEKTLLAALWFVPLIARGVATVTLVPLAVPLMLAIFVLLLHKAGLRILARRNAFGPF